MSLRKIQRGRLELTFVILSPIAVFALIQALEYGNCRRLERELATRRLWLKLVPEMEQRLDAVRQQMGEAFRAVDDADGSSDLTMRVNRLAQESGFAARTVKLTKIAQPEGGGGVCADYHVVVGGEGTIPALTGFLDACERTGPRPFRVVRGRVESRPSSPEPLYDAEFGMVSRALHGEKDPPAAAMAGFHLREAEVARRGSEIDRLMETIRRRGLAQVGPLPIAKFRDRPALRVAEAVEAPFRLTGVIRDAKKPLAMTDKGLLGVGDEMGGFRIVEIRSDKVVVETPGGGRVLVELYK